MVSAIVVSIFTVPIFTAPIVAASMYIGPALLFTKIQLSLVSVKDRCCAAVARAWLAPRWSIMGNAWSEQGQCTPDRYTQQSSQQS